VQADCFTDGHDVSPVCCAGAAKATPTGARRRCSRWATTAGAPASSMRWALGYTVTAWVDPFAVLAHEIRRRVDADDIRMAARAARPADREAALRAAPAATDRKLAGLGRRACADADGRRIAKAEVRAWKAGARATRRPRPHQRHGPTCDHAAMDDPADEFAVVVDTRAGPLRQLVRIVPAFGAWRWRGTARSRRASLACRRRRAWGSTCCIFPPIHPIGRAKRKGPQQHAHARADDVGSPWAIGAAEGGHDAILGAWARWPTSASWCTRRARALASRSRWTSRSSARPTTRGSSRHPDWFRHRPDGSVQYAENPPKKYQDIYPFDFETEAGATCGSRWQGVFEHWIAQGVRIFRVDNPHTKAFAFWEWAIADVRARTPGGDLPVRGVHAAQGDAPAGQARLHAVLHLLHLAQHQAGADRVLHRADARGRARVLPARTPGRTRPTSCPSAAVRRSAVFMARVVLAATLARTTASTARPTNCMEHRPREPAGTRTRSSTSCTSRPSSTPTATASATSAG
jgi:starch synthase (maltosyl-transferring)